MARITKDQIYKSVDLKREIIDLPEWGGEVEIQAMSVGKKLAYDQYIRDHEDFNDICYYLISISLINEDGSLFLNEEDKENIMSKSSESVMKIFNACIDLNKQRNDDVEKAAKN